MAIIYVRDGNGDLVPVSSGSVPNPDGNVAYDKAQKLTEEQKIQARENIGAQPAGNYLTSVPAGYATEDFVRRVITESAGSSVFFSGSTAVITPQELVDQLASGKCIAINHEDVDFGNIVFTGFTVIGELGVITATSVNSFVFDDVEVVMRYELVGDFQSNKWYFKYAPIGGISVTGATVGQTVKIAEVNNSGVPTAWEAVDFPSGVLGEKWELIAEGTITEEVDSITISADVDGNPFKLSKCYLYTIITPCEVVVDGSQYIGTRVNDNIVGNNLNSAANGTRYHQLFIEIVGRSLIATESCSTFPYNNTFSIKNNTPTNNWGFRLGDTINKVSLTLGNGKPGPHIGVNTKYEFYGVRV